MTYTYKFGKILSIKEKEKEEKQSQYEQSVREFEQCAETLYGLLKQKEDLEVTRQYRLEQGLAVGEMLAHQYFIDNLEKVIIKHQYLVIEARKMMQAIHEELVYSNIEVKKYEQIKKSDYEKYLFEQKSMEVTLMNEISIQQFVNRET
jgi:flagellar protein FliJ